MLPHPVPTAVNEYFNDFNTYAAGDWTVGPATGTSALTAGLGGFLTLTTGGVSGNGQGNDLTTPSFAFTPGYQTWFSINFTNAGNNIPNWIVGLTAGTSNTPTSGVYFTKATSSRQVQILINKGGAITTLTPTTLATAAQDGVALQLGFYYDGRPTSNLYFYSSVGLIGNQAQPSPTAFGMPPVYGGAMVASASNDGLNPNPLTNLPIVTLSPSFFIQTNAASTTTMAVDYVHAACEILRF
jgi:hypothetical protein